MSKVILAGVLFWSAHSFAEAGPFWSSGISYVDDNAGAESSAIASANLQCAPLAAERISEWSEGNTGHYVYYRAGAYFACKAN